MNQVEWKLIVRKVRYRKSCRSSFRSRYCEVPRIDGYYSRSFATRNTYEKINRRGINHRQFACLVFRDYFTGAYRESLQEASFVVFTHCSPAFRSNLRQLGRFLQVIQRGKPEIVNKSFLFACGLFHRENSSKVGKHDLKDPKCRLAKTGPSLDHCGTRKVLEGVLHAQSGKTGQGVQSFPIDPQKLICRVRRST